MAAQTLLNAVTGNTTGTGVAVTGNFEAIPTGTSYAGGTLELQMSVDDVDANYKPVGTNGQWNGPGNPAAITNTGTNYFRGVLKGCLSSMLPANATLKINQ